MDCLAKRKRSERGDKEEYQELVEAKRSAGQEKMLSYELQFTKWK